jgi:hypothetical protein
MATKETKQILEQALSWEKAAEENCDKVLHELKINGYHTIVESIKNDEHEHQALVQELLGYL